MQKPQCIDTGAPIKKRQPETGCRFYYREGWTDTLAGPYLFLFFKEALMKSRNRGWGSLGVDLNSGWNWHPRNQG